MKASVKLRRDEDPHGHDPFPNHNHFHLGGGHGVPLLPLLRAKVPITVLGLPFVSFASCGASSDDLSLQLRTDLPAGPSLRLIYHPDASAPGAPAPTRSPFTLSLKTGLGPWGSPRGSPLLLSARVPLPVPAADGPLTLNPTFTLQISADFGDFSLKKSSPLTSLAYAGLNPNPAPKENGGGIYRPLPVGRIEQGPDVPGFSPGTGALAVRTAFPVSNRAVLKLRWGVNLPSTTMLAEGAFNGNGSLPFLAVDKFSIERVEGREGMVAKGTGAGDWQQLVVKKGMDKSQKSADDGDLESLKGMYFWMKKEADDLQREQLLIREGIDELRLKLGSGTAKK